MSWTKVAQLGPWPTEYNEEVEEKEWKKTSREEEDDACTV